MAFPKNIQYPNLRGEMARQGVTIQNIATALEVTRDTASSKLSGKSPIHLDEAFVIGDLFFPGLDLRYLFARSN